MAFIPARPIIAEDPLAYFMPLTTRPAAVVLPLRPLGAIDQMYAYYTAE